MRVDPTQSELLASGLGALAAAQDRKAPRTAFAATLAATTTTTTAGTVTAATAAEPARADKLPKGPKGETTREVEGKPFLEILSGPRNGMFINTSGNERHGEAFVLVRRKDHDLHVYGTGGDRRVIMVPHGDGGGIPAPGPKQETTTKVEGRRDYVEVVSGPRNGMFINRSGNERDGRAFVLVERKDHELHIYGTGKDRRVIVARYDDEKPATPVEDAKDAPPATGGAAAPAA